MLHPSSSNGHRCKRNGHASTTVTPQQSAFICHWERCLQATAQLGSFGQGQLRGCDCTGKQQQRFASGDSSLVIGNSRNCQSTGSAPTASGYSLLAMAFPLLQWDRLLKPLAISQPLKAASFGRNANAGRQYATEISYCSRLLATLQAQAQSHLVIKPLPMSPIQQQSAQTRVQVELTLRRWDSMPMLRAVHL